MSAVKRGRWAKGLVLDSASRMSSSSKSVSFQAPSRLGHRPTLSASRSSGSDPAASSRSLVVVSAQCTAHVKRVKTQEGDVSVVVVCAGLSLVCLSVRLFSEEVDSWGCGWCGVGGVGWGVGGEGLWNG